MSATPVAASLPEDQCEWCGAPVKWVTELPGNHRVPIDVEPLPADHWQGDLVRVPPARCGGQIDCATDPTHAEWQYARSYRKHKMTCPNVDKWTGAKKWARPKPPRIRRSPETAALTDEQIRELQRIDELQANNERW